MNSFAPLTPIHKIRPSFALLVSATLLLSACATQPAQGQAAPAPTDPVQTAPGQAVPATLTPTRLVFSGVKTAVSPPQLFTLVNSGAQSLTVSAVTVTGPDAAAFTVGTPPALPLTLEAGKTLTLALNFSPQGKVGVLKASLNLETKTELSPLGAGGAPLSADLSGLSTVGLEGENEPPLAQVVQALGYGTDVGGSQLVLGTSPSLLGQEVSAQLFRKSGAGPVTLTPVARYSPAGPLEFGLFTLRGGTPDAHALGEIEAQQYQTLNPAFQHGQTSFDPGSEPFGVYTGATEYSKAADYTLDSLNKAFISHAMRVYPLSGLDSKALPAYLIATEASSNGDYQDAVFVLSGAEPAPPRP